jgi:serine/threonine protein kinase
LNQLERIVSFVGKPSRSDIESLNSEVAFTMIDSLTIPKPKPFKDWFKSDTSAEALDLLNKMLQFNPNKRPTAQ